MEDERAEREKGRLAKKIENSKKTGNFTCKRYRDLKRDKAAGGGRKYNK